MGSPDTSSNVEADSGSFPGVSCSSFSRQFSLRKMEFTTVSRPKPVLKALAAEKQHHGPFADHFKESKLME
jgi:hypothetical protein